MVKQMSGKVNSFFSKSKIHRYFPVGHALVLAVTQKLSTFAQTNSNNSSKMISSMKHNLFSFFFVLISLFLTIDVHANDGVFYVDGNELVPLTDTDIRLRKEVLNIRFEEGRALVEVNYWLENSGSKKSLLVGFEAAPPHGAWGNIGLARRVFPEHPHIRRFSVEVGGERLPFKVAHVGRVDTVYYAQGRFNEVEARRELNDYNEDYEPALSFYYVYYFDVCFAEGVTTIRHTYEYDMSDNVSEGLNLPYVLSAAGRWAGGEIEDFTLNIYPEPLTSLFVDETFFSGSEQWTYTGAVRMTQSAPRRPYYNSYDDESEVRSLVFHVQDGSLSFHQEHFRPQKDKELYIYSGLTPWDSDVLTTVQSFYGACRFKFYMQSDSLTPFERRVLRNLPFAYRGYVFKDKELQRVYEQSPWYIPNPEYKAILRWLPKDEQKWVLSF